MTLTGIIYHDVQESFSMDGPYLGELTFRDKKLPGKFLADGERLSKDKSNLVLSKYSGDKKKGLFGLGKQRCFHIIVYNENKNQFYQSNDTFDCLSIEKMDGIKITYHLAFHNSHEKYRRIIEFNTQNFTEINWF
jgi:hypothetical protein